MVEKIYSDPSCVNCGGKHPWPSSQLIVTPTLVGALHVPGATPNHKLSRLRPPFFSASLHHLARRLIKKASQSHCRSAGTRLPGPLPLRLGCNP